MQTAISIASSSQGLATPPSNSASSSSTAPSDSPPQLSIPITSNVSNIASKSPQKENPSEPNFSMEKAMPLQDKIYNELTIQASVGKEKIILTNVNAQKLILHSGSTIQFINCNIKELVVDVPTHTVNIFASANTIINQTQILSNSTFTEHQLSAKADGFLNMTSLGNHPDKYLDVVLKNTTLNQFTFDRLTKLTEKNTLIAYLKNTQNRLTQTAGSNFNWNISNNSTTSNFSKLSSSSTLPPTPPVGTPIIYIDTANLTPLDPNFATVFLASNKLQSLNGTLSHIKNLESLTIETKNGSLVVEKADIPLQENWSHPSPKLMMGGNTVTITALTKNGKSISKSIQISNFSQENSENIVLDETDTDGDGLLNYVEDMLNTDKTKVDTDGDGLSDFAEINITTTNPLLKDSDANGISDDKEDLDNDTLTNLEEVAFGSSPLSKDTDFDELDDNQEKQLGTNPMELDTDSDQLNDAREIERGTNPLIPDTNGNGILDGDEIVTVTVAVPESEKDENVTPSLSVKLAAQGADSITIEKEDPETSIYLPKEIPGFIGSGYHFNANENVQEATISFAFDKKFLSTKDFKPTIYYVDIENQEMSELADQTVDLVNCTVSAKTTHFSTYILLDKTEQDKAWEIKILPTDPDKLGAAIDLAFSIDRSGSMITNDPQNIRVKMAQQFVEILRDTDRTTGVGFDFNATLLYPLTSDKALAKEKLTNIHSGGGTNIGAGVVTAIKELIGTTFIGLVPGSSNPDDLVVGSSRHAHLEPMNPPLRIGESTIQNSPLIVGSSRKDASKDNTVRFILLLTDGVGSYDHSYTQLAIENGIKIYTIGLGTDYDDVLLKEIANSTGGQYYHADNADALLEEFKNIVAESIDVVTDTDNDGLSDYHEERIRLFNGLQIKLDPKNPDCDADVLKDGQEIVQKLKDGKVFFQMLSNPNESNGDGDVFDDENDPDPLKWNVSERDLLMTADISYLDLPSGFLPDLSTEWKGKINAGYHGLADVDELRGWKLVDSIYNSINGLQCMALVKDDNLVLAFRGSEKHNLIDFIQDFFLADFIGISTGLNLQVPLAKYFTKDLLRRYSNHNIYITGHSLGGYLAQMASSEVVRLKQSHRLDKTTIFNSPGLGFSMGIIFETDDIFRLSTIISSITSYRIADTRYQDIVSLIGIHAGNVVEIPISDLALELKDKLYEKIFLSPHALISFYENEQFVRSKRRGK